ncbi:MULTISPECIES: sensor histidine kinase [Rhizobium]|uniref:histidine kinase n=1 Tax=Rhizobium esperanzae TaxID=1967781 RepID=A0A7W6UMF8_9HYPH|nr:MULTISPECIES: HAMP domain-containing sensor histidine kinase [Rhizobium]MBB4439951.1 signal transduction histidine kinase [Rhizobium esperanzae]MDH6202482.1 signal transduction histidine kinase [Rhizobium leguminosarum]OAV54466.1 two-component sensor histidine kinase [Rhizobium sp. WYCCWR10014]
MRRQPSLKTRLIAGQLALQFLAVAAAAIGFVIFFMNSALDGMYVEETVIDVAARSVTRNAAGMAVVTVTPELARLREEAPDLWFAARLADGEVVTVGRVPAEVAALVPHLDKLASADLRGEFAPFTLSAILRRGTGPAGEMRIIAHGRVRPFTALIIIASNVVATTIFLILALISAIATPVIVKRVLAGITKTAEEAERIDAEQRGVRLSEDKVPREIAPLVRAFNEALGRLDEGHDHQRRFIASAAHELRTPVAILRMKIDASTDQGLRSLLPDVSRLATLSEQLLDLHRLDNGPTAGRIDLGVLARRVAADLAPVLIATGRTIEVVVVRRGLIRGDAGSIERALTNLIQNAANHGGNEVIVRVDGASLEVRDNGNGIPRAERSRVLEPFYRMRPHSTGVGLGLNLVKQVADYHGGRISIADSPGGGAIVRLDFRSMP